MRAVGFDLGETLVRYRDTPLSWQSLYRKALGAAAAACGAEIGRDRMAAAEAILARYNTRLNPRGEEVAAGVIFGAVLRAWDLPPDHLAAAIAAFFGFFQRRAEVYPDVPPVLEHLRRRGTGVGVLTDVPYGMPREYVERDLAPLAGRLDALVTSVDVGVRKPDPRGYIELARRLGVAPAEMVYVGNEPKDVEGATRAGCSAVLLDRDGGGGGFGEGLRAASLSELVSWLEGATGG